MPALLDAGVQLHDTRDNDGDTLFCAAAAPAEPSVDNIDMLRYLISQNVSVHETNHVGKGPLSRAIEASGYSTDTVRFLIDAGALLDMPDKNGDTPVLIAAKLSRMGAMAEGKGKCECLEQR